ncbi:uncharacterized protein LAESUDRAFT_347223 [Laetiporus sulphureus 93-53]|uniref:Uncharacterized protein n=1 Tax=Laetiporus sulphureus 93-53 TaxID=1314785 RepID=A0A165GSD6_9APHY|nr:uncharacterized protein LAESUDRAFT_347223 [Laetiporus sulphureus 93-53]KZT10742.1 hypothetical protein LAESUDRAFT_347223 [Laetiporus sulphureus 93-53]
MMQHCRSRPRPLPVLHCGTIARYWTFLLRLSLFAACCRRCASIPAHNPCSSSIVNTQSIQPSYTLQSICLAHSPSLGRLCSQQPLPHPFRRSAPNMDSSQIIALAFSAVFHTCSFPPQLLKVVSYLCQTHTLSTQRRPSRRRNVLVCPSILRPYSHHF